MNASLKEMFCLYTAVHCTITNFNIEPAQPEFSKLLDIIKSPFISMTNAATIIEAVAAVGLFA